MKRRSLEHLQSCVIENVLETEHEPKLELHVETIPEKEVGKYENIVCSHVAYVIKTREHVTGAMEACIFPHGNRDRERNNVKNVCTNSQFHVIRVVLLLETWLLFCIGVVDLKGAWIESGNILCALYVRHEEI